MKLNTFLKLVGALYTFRGVFGIFYLLLGWEASIAGWVVPDWLVVVAVVADAMLASAAFAHAKK